MSPDEMQALAEDIRSTVADLNAMLVEAEEAGIICDLTCAKRRVHAAVEGSGDTSQKRLAPPAVFVTLSREM